MKTNRVFAFGAVSMVMLAGLAISPARADRDDYAYRRDRRQDIVRIQRDERRLQDLLYRRDQERREHDWRAMRSLDQQIDRLRDDIARERRDMERDRRDQRRDDRDDRYDRRDRQDRWKDDHRW